MFLLSFINNAERGPDRAPTDRDPAVRPSIFPPGFLKCAGTTGQQCLRFLLFRAVFDLIGNRFRQREKRNVNNCINDSLRPWRKGNAEIKKERKHVSLFPRDHDDP